MVQAEKVYVKVTSPPTRPPPPANTVAQILRHLTSSYATIIINTATSVCRLININVVHTKLLAQTNIYSHFSGEDEQHIISISSYHSSQI